MKQPRIIEVFPSWWPYLATMLFGVIFIKKGRTLSDAQIRHEMIHFEQQRELLFLLFIPVYIFEFIVRFLFTWNWRKAYRNISFEQEAYQHQEDENYLGRDGTRRPYAWRTIQVEDRKYWWSRYQGFVYAAFLVAGFGLAHFWQENSREMAENRSTYSTTASTTGRSIFANYDTTTVEWVYNHYQSNEIRADEIFKGKQFVVYGRIYDIGATWGDYYIRLEDQTGRAQMFCYFEEGQVGKLKNLSAGQWVYIGGTGAGQNIFPDMDNCWIH